MIDLHMHTNVSDGKLTPAELIDLSLEKGLKAIAITDHDSVAGITAAIEHAKGKSIEVIPGIEISCDESEIGFKEVHVIGLFINPNHKKLLKFIESAKEERVKQKEKMVKKLQNLGFDISFEELKRYAKESFGRPHIARLLIKKYPKQFSSIEDVFRNYLAVGKPAYADRENKCGAKQAITLVKNAGGLSFLAHPGVFKKNDSLELIDFFRKQGGQGIETYYPYHIICPELKIDKIENQKLIEFYRQTAEANKMLEAGGSDFHGGDRQTINAIKIQDSVLDKLKKALKN